MITSSEDPKVAEFHEALARAFGAVEHAQQTGRDGNKKKAGKDRPYSTLLDVDRACREALTSEGFSYPQFPATRWTEDGRMFISVSTLLCRGGVTLAEDAPFELPVLGQRQSNASGGGHGPPDAQAVGSALTYARRYSLGAVMGICPEDDDGHAASSPQQEKPDPKWDQFQVLIRQLMGARKLVGKAGEAMAYKAIKDAADTFPGGGGPNDAELGKLMDAALRLLQPPKSEPTPIHRLNAILEQLAKRDKTTMEETRLAVELEAGVSPEGTPTPAQVVTLLGAAERLRDAPKAEVQATRTEAIRWGDAARALVYGRIADYKTAKGAPPSQGTIDSMWEEARTVSAKAARMKNTAAFSPKTATEKQLDAATAAIKKEIAKRAPAGEAS